MKERPIRKPNRLKQYDYSDNGAYFITVCTKNRKNLFWEKEQEFVGEDIILPQKAIRLTKCGKFVQETIEKIPNHYEGISLDSYAIMPNHVHLVLFFDRENGQMISAPTLSTVIGQMKRVISKEIGYDVWQRSFHDHVIRDIYDYEEISKYVYENPSKWIYDKLYVNE
ncbi:MAG: transposase [Clostridia bacterium]|nr:transposase [Clostridia bacterium]